MIQVITIREHHGKLAPDPDSIEIYEDLGAVREHLARSANVNYAKRVIAGLARNAEVTIPNGPGVLDVWSYVRPDKVTSDDAEDVILETVDDESLAWDRAEDFIAADRSMFGGKKSPHRFGVKKLYTRPVSWAIYVRRNEEVRGKGLAHLGKIIQARPGAPKPAPTPATDDQIRKLAEFLGREHP